MRNGYKKYTAVRTATFSDGLTWTPLVLVLPVKVTNPAGAGPVYATPLRPPSGERNRNLLEAEGVLSRLGTGGTATG